MKSPTPNKELNDELQFVLECTADLEKQNPPIVTGDGLLIYDK